MAGRRSGADEAFADAFLGMMLIVAIVATIVAIWLAVRAANSISNALDLRPRSRLLWGLIGLFLGFLALALVTQAPLWWAAAGTTLVVLVLCAQLVVVSAEPLLRDPARHEFLHDVMNDWWPEVPGAGWAEVE